MEIKILKLREEIFTFQSKRVVLLKEPLSLQFNEHKTPWASLDVALICRLLEIISFDITAHY